MSLQTKHGRVTAVTVRADAFWVELRDLHGPRRGDSLLLKSGDWCVIFFTVSLLSELGKYMT